jgi:hypothetical protein
MKVSLFDKMLNDWFLSGDFLGSWAAIGTLIGWGFLGNYGRNYRGIRWELDCRNLPGIKWYLELNYIGAFTSL